MKALQIVLFMLANVIFITQSARDAHQLVFGAEASVLDQFEPEKQKARAEKDIAALVAEYRAVDKEVRALKKEKDTSFLDNDPHQKIHDTYYALKTEITARELRGRELRDLWLYSSFGALLIVGGGILYRRRFVWPGLSLVVTGFGILEYWSSPTFFGGATVEFHALLLSKTLLTLLALALLYGFWRLRKLPEKEWTIEEMNRITEEALQEGR